MNLIHQICLIAVSLLLVATATTAKAYDDGRSIILAQSACASKAQSLASQYSGARIVSVSQSGSTCEVVIEVPASGGTQPRILRKKLPAS